MGRKTFSENTKVNIDHIYFVNELFDSDIKVDIEKLNKIRQNDEKGAMCMVYTSGTESFPKLALISEKSIVKSLYSLKDALYVPEGLESVLVALPFNHLYAMTVFLYSLLLISKKVVFTYNLTPDYLLQIVEKNKVQAVYSIVQLINGIAVSKNNDAAKKQLLACINSGCPVSEKDYDLYNKMFPNAIFYHVYGLTEATGPVSVLYTKDAKILNNNNGKVLAGIDIKIAKNGEILIKGDILKEKYYKLPDEKQGIDIDGYFHTGDMGELDSEGNLYVKGRLKDIIIKGGENISSKEIEEVLLSDKNISSAAVIGKKSEKYGEDIYAYITIKEDYIFDEIKTKNTIAEALGNFKVPVTVIDKMPMNGLGKIEKKELEKI